MSTTITTFKQKLEEDKNVSNLFKDTLLSYIEMSPNAVQGLTCRVYSNKSKYFLFCVYSYCKLMEFLSATGRESDLGYMRDSIECTKNYVDIIKEVISDIDSNELFDFLGYDIFSISVLGIKEFTYRGNTLEPTFILNKNVIGSSVFIVDCPVDLVTSLSKTYRNVNSNIVGSKINVALYPYNVHMLHRNGKKCTIVDNLIKLPGDSTGETTLSYIMLSNGCTLLKEDGIEYTLYNLFNDILLLNEVDSSHFTFFKDLYKEQKLFSIYYKPQEKFRVYGKKEHKVKISIDEIKKINKILSVMFYLKTFYSE